MKISVMSGKIELTLAELSEIVSEREKHAKMNEDHLMPNGKENPLVHSYNDGVDMMARYIMDYFGNEFDKAHDELYKNGGGW